MLLLSYVDFGVLQLYKWFVTKTYLEHEPSPEKGSWADIWRTYPAPNGIAHLFSFDGESWCLKKSGPD